LGSGNVDDRLGFVEILGDSSHTITFPSDWISANGVSIDNTKRNCIYFHYINGKVFYAVIASALLDTTPPTLLSLDVYDGSPSQIVLFYNESILTSSVPAVTDFTLNLGRTVTAVAIVGSSVTLTVSSPYAFGDVITASYTGGTNKIKDLAGNLAPNFATLSVTNSIVGVDTTAPTLVTAVVNNATKNQIELTYNEGLKTTPLPATTDFAVSGGKTVSAVAIAAGKVTLTVTSNYAFGDVITVSYTAGTNKIQDIAGNLAANLVSQAVTNNVAAGDVTAPAIVSATIAAGTPTQIAMLYNEALLTTPLPATTDFAIAGKTISSVAISGSTVTLTLSASVIAGDILQLTYVGGTNKIKDLAGNNAVDLTNYAVTNNSTVFGNLKSVDFAGDATKFLVTTAVNPTALSMSSNWAWTGKIKYVATGAIQSIYMLSNGTQHIFWVYIDATGKLNFRIYTSPTVYTNYVSATLSTSSWSSIVITGAGSGSLDVWINNTGLTGSLTWTTSGTPSSIKSIDSDTFVKLGGNAASLVDEIGLFNYRFNATNTAEIYNSGVTKNLATMATFTPGGTNFLQAWYRFENNFNDSSVNVFHLSIGSSGTPTYNTDRLA
jgi:uncharacterized repeat protein (TIGR02059 family)